jgi:hypothetical protein
MLRLLLWVRSGGSLPLPGSSAAGVRGSLSETTSRSTTGRFFRRSSVPSGSLRRGTVSPLRYSAPPGDQPHRVSPDLYRPAPGGREAGKVMEPKKFLHREERARGFCRRLPARPPGEVAPGSPPMGAGEAHPAPLPPVGSGPRTPPLAHPCPAAPHSRGGRGGDESGHPQEWARMGA